MKRNDDSLRDLWDNFKCTNIHIIGVPKGEEKKKGPEKIFEEIIIKNFPNMGKEIATQVQEAQRVPGRINPRRNMPRHIVIKLTKIKDKEKIIESNKGKMTNNIQGGASLVAQWLRVCLPVQGTRVRALVWEDPTCRGAARPVSHNY